MLPGPDGQIYTQNRRGVVPARFLFPPREAQGSFILQGSYVQKVHCPEFSWLFITGFLLPVTALKGQWQQCLQPAQGSRQGHGHPPCPILLHRPLPVQLLAAPWMAQPHGHDEPGSHRDGALTCLLAAFLHSYSTTVHLSFPFVKMRMIFPTYLRDGLSILNH